MSDITVQGEKRSNLSALYFIGIWVIYALVYFVLKANTDWAGVLSFIVLTAASTTLAIYATGSLWKKAATTKLESRRIFGFFSISFASVAILDLTYQLIYNVLHLKHGEVSSLLISAYNIPYLLFLLFQILAFGSIFPKKLYVKKISAIFAYTPVVVLVSILCTVLFLSYKIDLYNNFSLSKFYDLAETVLQIGGFVLAILCIATAKNKGVIYLSVGYLVAVVTDLIMNLNIMSQYFGVGEILESMWMLTYVLCMYGLFYFKRSGTYKEAPATWTYANDSLKSQSTYWFLVAGLLTAGLSSAITYAFLPNSIFF